MPKSRVVTQSQEVESAINLVALALLADLGLEDWIEWEDVPLICESDFEAVREAAQSFVWSLRPKDAFALRAAHALLAGRADNDA